MPLDKIKDFIENASLNDLTNRLKSYGVEFEDDWDALNQCKDCPAVDGCAGMNGECPYSKER